MMKYIKPFIETKFQINEDLRIYSSLKEKEKGKWLDELEYILLPISDDLIVNLNIVSPSNGEKISIVNIQIHAMSESNYEVFSINDYIDEIERAINYIKKKDFILSEYNTWEVKEKYKNILYIPHDKYSETCTYKNYRNESYYNNLLDKQAIVLTLVFKNKNINK